MKIFQPILLCACCTIAVINAHAQQVADTGFHYKISHPLYTKGSGTAIVLDEAHYNFHTMEDRYAPFANFLQQDGYVVLPGKEKFTPDYLNSIRILVIANALPDTGDWVLPARSAFTKDEVAAVNNWVQNGGSLFLIADHIPFSGAAADLALSFGFNFINGYAARNDDDPETFSKSEGTLTNNILTKGRRSAEAIDSITIFTGQGFIPPKNATAITLLDKHYKVYLPSDAAADINSKTPVIDGHGLVNGAFMNYGKGRIVVFGEAAMFSAQLAGPQQEKIGMNNPAANQNPQFLLNIIHWLDRKL